MKEELDQIDELLKKIRTEMIDNRKSGIKDDGAGTDWPPIVIGHCDCMSAITQQMRTVGTYIERRK